MSSDNRNSKSGPPPGSPAGAGAPDPGGHGPDALRHDSPVTNNVSGRVKFDDRGNAVWEWAMRTGTLNADPSTSRLRKLESTELSLADEAPPPSRLVKDNPQGVARGYSPYESGLLAKKEPSRKKDLRRLSEWLKLKKQAEANKQNDDE